MAEALGGYRIVPVVVIEDPTSAAPLGDALARGGLPCAEVTFRTPKAEQALAELARDERLYVGAGSVRNPDQVDRAAAAGARFIVSPGMSAAVIRQARSLGLPVLPGIATATELMAALDEGVDLVKFFPAGQLGGPAMLRTLAAVFPDVRFVPTGGITAESAPSYLELPCVAAIGGSWMVASDLIRGGAFDRIAELSAAAAALA
jgi:2-dehydro-3-deoxyphosphogluconate aldolase / (4S)-4-hydroxy-2-oxoglutarate aldolase